LLTPGLRRRRVLPIPVLLYHPIPSDRERKGSNFFLSSNSFAKKNFSFFSALQPLAERRYSFKAGANIDPLFFICKCRCNIFLFFFLFKLYLPDLQVENFLKKYDLGKS